MAGELPQYCAWVRTQECRMHMHDPCEGRIEAHHAGRRPGIAMKAHDNTCVPLCTKHHRAWHDASGVFRHMRKDERRTWADRQIEWTWGRWEKVSDRAV